MILYNKIAYNYSSPSWLIFSYYKLRVISNPRDRISTSFQGIKNITYVKPSLRTIVIDRYPTAAPTAVVTVTWPYGSDLWSYLERTETINPRNFLGRDSGFSGIFTFSCNKVMMVELLRPKEKSFIFLKVYEVITSDFLGFDWPRCETKKYTKIISQIRIS